MILCFHWFIIIIIIIIIYGLLVNQMYREVSERKRLYNTQSNQIYLFRDHCVTSELVIHVKR